jgi:hypothetical protein
MTSPRQRAEVGLELIESAILEYIKSSEGGVSNVEIAEKLGLQSDIDGEQRNRLSWSILGNLINKKKIVKVGENNSARYVAVI